MNPAIINPSPATLAWLESEQGQLALQARVTETSRNLMEDGLVERLQRELESSKQGGTKVFRIGNSLRALSGDLTILVLAHQFGVKISPELWEIGRKLIGNILALDALVFQGRLNKPVWKSDLWTSDIGINLAVLSYYDSPLACDKKEIGRFLETECWRPIQADWIDDATRIHSLDSMGHNWWSVIVGGAGMVAALCGWKKEALATCDHLAKWFAYPGNPFGRKNPNFGAEGDFVEGYAYGEYAVLHPFILSFLTPEYESSPAWLTPAQLEGMSAWFKRAFLPKRDGTWWPQRFGDIHLIYKPKVSVWHTLARWTQDNELLEQAHKIQPTPTGVFDFLMWEPLTARTTPKTATSRKAPRDFPTSGLAYLGDHQLSLTVRAGEFWNHNHLDAGTFIHSENGVVWADDGGACVYSQAEYGTYYLIAKAHNVAYALDLVPANTALNHYEGLPVQGRHLFHEQAPNFEVLATDTLALSGGALARSLRLFVVLDDAVTLIWDDLQAHRPEVFESLFHTTCGVPSSAEGTSLSLEGPDGQTCPLSFFSDQPALFSAPPVMMGELSNHMAKPGSAMVSLEGTCLTWRTEKTLRQKFGLALGCTLRSAQWKTLESGWECSFQSGTSGVAWSVWFNRLADGSVMHRNCIGTWLNFETDAYAVALREENGKRTLYAVQSSFVRRHGTVLMGNLTRSVVTCTNL